MYKNVYKYDDMKRAEHMAVRETVGWYLFTHEIIEVTGADAASFAEVEKSTSVPSMNSIASSAF